jgi:effector-binding domain-containing protein
MTDAIDIVTVPSRRVAATSFYVDDDELGTIGQRMGAAFGAVLAHLQRLGITPADPAVACYRRSREGFVVSAGFPVGEAVVTSDEVSTLVLPAGEVAHTTHLGPYERLGEAYDALRVGASERGRTLDDAAPMWEEYWSGPEAPPDETRTEVFWPLVGG